MLGDILTFTKLKKFSKWSAYILQYFWFIICIIRFKERYQRKVIIMKKSLFFYLFTILSCAAFSQKDVVHIQYTVNVKVDAVGLLGSVETEGHDHDHDHEVPDFGKQDNNTIFKTQIDNLGKKTTETHGSQTRDYYVGDSLIRLDRNTNKMSDDEFVLIEPVAKKMTTYYTSFDEKPTFTENQLVSAFVDSTKVYEIDTLHKDTKNILGYQSYKIIITELHKTGPDHEHIIKKYELYVTDELSLSANIVTGMWQIPLDICALEIKESTPENPSTFIVTQATEINKKQKNDLLELPPIYYIFHLLMKP